MTLFTLIPWVYKLRRCMASRRFPVRLGRRATIEGACVDPNAKRIVLGRGGAVTGPLYIAADWRIEAPTDSGHSWPGSGGRS